MSMYELFSLPHGFKFKTLTTQQARENFEAFVSRISDRIGMLEELLRSELPAWRADLSAQSLAALGVWFASHVEERPVTPREREELGKQMEPIRAPADVNTKFAQALAEIHTEFTPLTLSLGVDMGIYLGECVRARCPMTAWKLNRRSKEPVVSGIGLKEDYYPAVKASLAHSVIRARRKAALAGMHVKEPVTLEEKLTAIELSIPDKDPRTMLHDILVRIQERPARSW